MPFLAIGVILIILFLLFGHPILWILGLISLGVGAFLFLVGRGNGPKYPGRGRWF
jgi:hypothetical protein